MLSLPDIQSSNSRIASALPPGLVAVFVGATSGIGETTLKQFAKHTRQPHAYFVGRSQEAGDRIAAECKALNSDGQYIFVKADTSLIHTVDDVCRDIKSKEKAVNLLFLSTGTLLGGTKTSEGLHYIAALVTYSRTRFIVNLLPLLQQATALRRVVSVFAAGKEGPVDTSDFQGWKVPILSQRGQASSLVTLSLEALAKKAPDVSFIHDFPGPVKTNLVRGGEGAAIYVLNVVFKVIGPLVNTPIQESGERHLFLATSARYPAGMSGDATSGVPMTGGVELARGTNGKSGSGVYSVDQDGESAGPKMEELLTKLRKEGVVEKMWKDTEEHFKRITGLEAA
ncbi:MAG: Short-chain dehydrogenase reductase SDR [Lasallia pustulata]|uniref:Short-chain dehydrogenase reductase SDR n=1 Tax=Lasallia pustulata TaxID=136370 RepID=A0A5M8PQA1_9LECA|nr:MAG: Short-chain dehydrogenase reductase SDR [Lasallia pustulata]